MKKIISILLTVLMVASLATVAFAAQSATVSAKSMTVEAGKEYEIPVTITAGSEYNSFDIYVEASEGLTLTGMTMGTFNNALSMTSDDFTIGTMAAESIQNATLLLTLKVKVAEDAVPGEYYINFGSESLVSITYDGGVQEDLVVTYAPAVLTITCDHVWGDWTVTTAATCTTEGVETRTCSVCGETETRAIAKVDHTWGDWTVTTPATCQAEGVETHTCSVCGETETKAIAKTAHDWSDWTVTTAATCTAEGVETRTCSICGESETKAIAKVAHTTGEWACDGDNHWHVCSVCNEIVDLGAHDMKRTAVLQTATKEGETTIEQYNCTVCNWKEIREYPWTKDEGDITGVVTTGIAALVIVLCSTVAIVNNKRKAI